MLPLATTTRRAAWPGKDDRILPLWIVVAGRLAPVSSWRLALSVFCALVAGLAFTSVAWLVSREEAGRLADRVGRLEASLDAAESASARTRHDLEARLASADAAGQRSLERLSAQLAAAVTRAQEQSAARDAARLLADGLQDRLQAETASLAAALAANEDLDRRRASAEARALASARELGLARQDEKSLQGRIAALDARLDQLRATVDTATDSLRAWLASHVETVTAVLGDLGIDASPLLARAAAHEGAQGQGGPLELVSADDGGASLRVPWAGTQSPLVLRLERLQAAQRLLAALPLASPLVQYEVTSAFGVREDPIEGGHAVHPGLDLAAPPGTTVHAAAAGRVVRAGRDGAYGIMVEVDHGLGLVTRYAHLRRTLVKPGDEVRAYDPLGILGSTGRSTGPHLHYEVRIDDRAVDPAAFIEAGRRLVHVPQG